MRWTWLLIFLALSDWVWARGNLLQQLLEQQRRSFPEATITSGFYDSRGVSRYRSQPGLHLGYDIAMPWGASVRAAWPGVIEAHIPWSDNEWGVLVRHSDGSSATYGHVRPLLRPGMVVGPGDILAEIASDHLDVKMRDAQGNPFDYGAGLALHLEIHLPQVQLGPTPAQLRFQACQSRLRSQLQQRLAQPERLSQLTPAQVRQLQDLGLASPKATQVRVPLEPDWKQLALDYEKAKKEGGLGGDAVPLRSLKEGGLGGDAVPLRSTREFGKIESAPLSGAEWTRLDRAWEAAQADWKKQQQLYPLGITSRRQWEQARQRWQTWQQIRRCAQLLGT